MLAPSRVLALAVWSAGLLAQAPSPWVDLQLPAPSPTGQLSADGKLVLYRDGTFLRVFSAVTNQWHAHTPSFGTTPVLKKDMLLVPESDRWTAFSAYTGQFVVQFVPFAASTIQHDDSVACVLHGSTLHTFSAFTGTWNTRTIPAGWEVQLSSRIALLRTPFTATNLGASAFDVYTGQWHDVPLQPLAPYTASVSGSTAVVATTAMQFGFSAMHGGWVAQPVAVTPPIPQVTVYQFERELAPGRGSLFSGITGTFAPPPFGPSGGVVSVDSNLATAFDGSNQMALGAGRNVWMPMPSVPYVSGGSDLALAYGSGDLHAFSPLLGTIASTPWIAGGLSYFTTRRNIAAAFDAASGSHPVFSMFTGIWHVPPGNSLAEMPWVDDNNALFRTTSGVTAFSAHTGSFVPLPGTSLTRHNGYCVSDPSTLYVFDAFAARWLSHPLQAGTGYPSQFGLRTMLTTDATHAIAFSKRSHRLASIPLPEPVGYVHAADDVGFVRSATHVLAFSGLAETVTWQDAPEGIYGVGLGATATVQARTPAGHFVAMAFGPPIGAPQPLPPWGDLWIDPANAVLVVMQPGVGALRAVLPITIPNSLALRGTTWVQQAVTIAPAGPITLGDPSTLLVQ